jgi:ABC-type sulfate/molybdate transport systems ATPase subunit
VPSLELRGLAWQAPGSRLRLGVMIRPGESAVVVTGPEAGSALADAVLGLARPLAGSVLVDGRDVTGLAVGTRGIAVVPPGGALLPHLTVERNIAYAGDRAYADERIRDLRLEAIRRLRPHELSPGQRLQVAVARALCHAREPVAIVFEDRSGEAPFRAAVATARAHGAAVLVITDPERGAGLSGAVHPEEVADET